MAAPVKKRDIQRNTEDSSSDDDDLNSSNREDNEQDTVGVKGMNIQVDLEGRNPFDPDYHGIKTLLQQLFLKAHVDLGELTDLIISQNYVGTVVKQSDDIEDSDDEENDDDDTNNVFGVTTVINLSSGQNHTCVQQLRELLTHLASEHATDAINAIIKQGLENDSEALGLLINERFVNIPAQISVPLLEDLTSEIKRAANKKMPFSFNYYVLICKLYKTENPKVGKKSKSKKKAGAEEPLILWSNPEEEIFAEEATFSFEFSVEKESDSGLSGSWTETDNEMVPYRRVLLFEATKLQPIIDKIKLQLSLLE